MVASFVASDKSSVIDLRSAKGPVTLSFPVAWGGGATMTIEKKVPVSVDVTGFSTLMKDDNTAYTINIGAGESVVLDDALMGALGVGRCRLSAASSNTGHVGVSF